MKKAETNEDLRREREIIDKITSAQNGEIYAQKLPMYNHLDFAVMRGDRITGLVEIKCRTNSMRAYSSMIVHLSKVLDARKWAEACGCPAFLFVQWTDKLGWINFDEEYTVGFGGRKVERFDGDRSLMAYFDIDLFREWEE